MRHRFISERCKIFSLLLLLAAGSAALHAQDQPGIKNIRTVVYEPLKGHYGVTGKVVDYITFVKYDSKGRKMVENRLKPDGSPHGKLVCMCITLPDRCRVRFMQLRIKESAIVGAIHTMKKGG